MFLFLLVIKQFIAFVIQLLCAHVSVIVFECLWCSIVLLYHFILCLIVLYLSIFVYTFVFEHLLMNKDVPRFFGTFFVWSCCSAVRGASPRYDTTELWFAWYSACCSINACCACLSQSGLAALRIRSVCRSSVYLAIFAKSQLGQLMCSKYVALPMRQYSRVR